MAEGLAERGHEVHVVTYHLGEDDHAPSIRVHRIPDDPAYTKLSPGPTYRKLFVVDRALHRLLKRLLRELSIDVIHAHHYEGLIVAASARRGTGIPLVYDAHTLLMSELPYYRLGLPAAVKRGVGRWFDRKMPALANHTVCVTDTIYNKLVTDAGYDPARLTVITNGVEFEHFDSVAQSVNRPAGGRNIVFAGNLAEYQGVDYLLKAFARVIARLPDARLKIATDSPFAPYESMARGLNVLPNIDLIDSPTFAQLPGILAAADVAANPRVGGDGVPMKLLNYMAAGRAVVSFDSSAPGVVHGVNGWLAPSGDTEAFAQGIVRLLEDRPLADAIGAGARQYVLENRRWPVVAERCEKIYRQLLGAVQ